MAEEDKAEPGDPAREQTRSQLALKLAAWIMSAIGVLIAIGFFLLLIPTTTNGKVGPLSMDDRIKLLQTLLTALLPLFGAWLGTVLTHYYSREAYELASRQAR